MPQRVRLFLLFLYLPLLAACGGGGGSPGFDDTPVGAGGSGTLAVVINNLPAAVNATVRVTGPNNFSQDLVQSQNLSGLAVGTYTVSASTISLGITSYVPFPATQSASVTAGATTTVTVAYAANAPAPRLAAASAGRRWPVQAALAGAFRHGGVGLSSGRDNKVGRAAPTS